MLAACLLNVMFKNMKLRTINDIKELPSVLDVDEVNLYLIQLIDILKRDNTDSLIGAKTINNLISYQGYNEQGLSIKASLKILEYIKETYNPDCKESVYWNTGNLANLTCKEAETFMEIRLSVSESAYEKQEIAESLSEFKKTKHSNSFKSQYKTDLPLNSMLCDWATTTVSMIS